MTFYNTISIPADFSGTRLWVQVGTSRVRQLQDANLAWHVDTQLGPPPYGDTPIPYVVIGTTPVDSPGLPLPGGYVRGKAANTFEMWMMFQPPNGQWVPLRAVNWSWSGVATNGPTGWGVESGTNSVDPPDSETEDYPIWKSEIRNREWIPPL
jgi:hypothetical protein